MNFKKMLRVFIKETKKVVLANKKKLLLGFLSILILLIIIIYLVTYDGNKAFYKKLRSIGFSDLNEHFICNDLVNKENVMMSTRKYSFIAIDGQVYDIAFNRIFDDNQNCKMRNFETKLVSHIDNIVIGENGKYYSTYEDLKLKEDISFDFDTTDIVQKTYQFVLKKDGNIYFQKDEKNPTFSLKYKKEDFEGKIQSMCAISSDYTANETRKIVVMTDKAIYFTRATNKKECKKYADVVCDYHMIKDEFLSKNRKYILFVDDSTLITKDGKILYTNNYFDQ